MRRYVIHGAWLVALLGIIAGAAALGNGHSRVPAATSAHTLYFAATIPGGVCPSGPVRNANCDQIYSIDARAIAAAKVPGLAPGGAARHIADVPTGIDALAFAGDGTSRLLYLTRSDPKASGSGDGALDLWSVDVDGSDQHLVRRSVTTADRVIEVRLPGGIGTPATLPGGIPPVFTARAFPNSPVRIVRFPSLNGSLWAFFSEGIDSQDICVNDSDSPRTFGDPGCLVDGFYVFPVWQPR